MSAHGLLEHVHIRAEPSGFEVLLVQRADAAADDTAGFNPFVFNYTAATLADTTAINVTAVALHNSSRTVRPCPLP